MHQTNPEPLGELLPRTLKHLRKQHGVLFEIQKSWPRWVGNDLAAHTRPVSFRSGRLTVLVERPGDSFTLRYQIPQLLRFLKAATQDKAEEIIIRPGEPSNFTS